MRSAVTDFRTIRGPAPLPLLLLQPQDAPDELIRRALTHAGLGEASVSTLIRRGLVSIFLDGASEAKLDRETIEPLLAADHCGACMLVLSSRPASLRKQLVLGGVQVVELALDMAAAQAFARHLRLPFAESAAVLEICKDRTGGYRPLVVRMAMETDVEPRSILDVYVRCFERMAARVPSLSSDPKSLLDQAQSLAFVTHWRHGRHVLNLSDVKHADQIHPSLFAGLKQAGIIIDAPDALPGSSWYRFFHDSMLTSLTARHIAGLDDGPRRDSLLVAAGAARFLDDRAHSELFDVCITACAPTIVHDLRTVLTDLLARPRLHGSLSCDDVRGALPDLPTISRVWSDKQGDSGASALRAALPVLDDLPRIEYLFKRLAPILAQKGIFRTAADEDLPWNARLANLLEDVFGNRTSDFLGLLLRWREVQIGGLAAALPPQNAPIPVCDLVYEVIGLLERCGLLDEFIVHLSDALPGCRERLTQIAEARAIAPI